MIRWAVFRRPSVRLRRAAAAGIIGMAAVAGMTSTVGAASGTAAAPRAQISGPITGGIFGRPYGSSLVDLHPSGYTETEYFASGTATGGGSTAVVQEPDPYSPPSPYVTRILVRRPSDPAAFNGTVLVEWLNVTEGADLDVDWAEGHREILHGGYAYVAVSAQQGGVNALKRWDPVRYGSLNHPGDTYADSMYAQVLAAIRYGNGLDPLAGLHIRHIIADGHSQSGINLHAYVDHVQSVLPLADGFLIRGDVITQFDWAKLRTPVLQYQSESEIDGPAGIGLQQPNHYVAPVPPAPDSRDYRLWQVAGAAHIDKQGNDYTLDIRQRDDFAQPVTWDENAEGSYDGSGNADCPSSLGLGPSDKFPQWYTLDAAIHALNAWVSTGQAPASAPRVSVDSSGAPARDVYGNAVGGVRNPAVDAPVATYHGDEGCPLVGVTRGLSAATLATLYPTRADYVAAVSAAASGAEREGWLLDYDIADVVARAQTAAGPPA